MILIVQHGTSQEELRKCAAERRQFRKAAIASRRFVVAKTITVARAGGRNDHYKNMTRQPKEITLQEALNLAAEDTARAHLKKAKSSADLFAEHESAGKQVERIFDTLMERTGALLLPFGIEVVRSSAFIRPIAETSGLAEKLAKIEIIPEVTTNASTNDK